jgi:hypothetical protein
MEEQLGAGHTIPKLAIIPDFENTRGGSEWEDVEMSDTWAAVIVGLAVLFTIGCLVDLARPSRRVSKLPKWGWALICIVSEPWGGIVYLVVGRDTQPCAVETA